MRSKAPLVLMEQLVMLLVFALAAAVCIRAFALSERIAVDNAALDRAVQEAERAAELWKSGGGDGAALEAVGFAAAENGWELRCDEDFAPTQEADAPVIIRVMMEEGAHNPSFPMLRAQVEVLREEEILFSIPVACQEVTP